MRRDKTASPRIPSDGTRRVLDADGNRPTADADFRASGTEQAVFETGSGT